MDEFDVLAQCEGFEWDEHNSEKNRRRHQVKPDECEEVFLNRPLVMGEDAGHSQNEARFYALGRTDSERMLFVAFTVREMKIRVISARDMNRKEKKFYENSEED